MFDDLTKEEWMRWERVERDFRAHPALYRLRLAALFAEGILVALLLFAVVALMLAASIAEPLAHLRLIVFLVFNLFATVAEYSLALTHRPWAGLPELGEKEWPRLHGLVRETGAALGAPRIHRIFLDPGEFNACVAVAFPLVPGLRRNVLVLGYPLLAALGARGLRGVLAHELGHVAHRDTVRSGALLHVRTFWTVVGLGVFTWLLIPWRRSYLRRINRLMSPLERAWELAADRAIEEHFGQDALRETLVSLELRGADADLGEILRPLVGTEGASPAAAIRAALRRVLPPDTARRRLMRALRSINPPMEEHPPLAVRLRTGSAIELLPFAQSAPDVLEKIFGGDTALDAVVDAALAPALASLADEVRETRADIEHRLAGLPVEGASPDALIEQIVDLRVLERKDEASQLLKRARAAHPDNAALEAIELGGALAEAATAEAGAPLANRLEQLIAADPMMLAWAENPLFSHYLETGASDRIRNLLDLRRHGERALRRRLGAKLRPTDELSATPLTEAERADVAKVFVGHAVKEVYPVRRAYGGTGIASFYYVVRWSRPILGAGSMLKYLDDAFDDAIVVAGTRALFRRFDELGIKPIRIAVTPPIPADRGSGNPPPRQAG